MVQQQNQWLEQKYGIVKYDNRTSDTIVTGNFYCVRAGVGFKDTNEKVQSIQISYDLKTEKSAILASGNTVLQSIVNNGYYNNLLALTDLVYLKGVSTEEEKSALLTQAGIDAQNYTVALTDDDIEAVQQAAIWYFTNHDDTVFNKVYNQFGDEKTSWLFYRTLDRCHNNGESYKSLSDYNLTFNRFGDQTGEGKNRQEQAVILYNYLISTANKNAAAYANNTATPKTKVTLYANAVTTTKYTTNYIN